jgi:hypothetical protein
MQELFRFSKIASLVVFLMAIIQTVSVFYLKDLSYWYWKNPEIYNMFWTVRSISGYLFYGIVLIYFLLIYRNSAKESVLRIPSLIGFISAIACLILPIIMSYMDNYDYSTRVLLGQIGNYIGIVSACGLSVAIIWTAKYLKILPRIFAYLCVLSVILLALLPVLWDLDLMRQLFDWDRFNLIIDIIKLSMYILFAVFYFLFSKMANK